MSEYKILLIAAGILTYLWFSTFEGFLGAIKAKELEKARLLRKSKVLYNTTRINVIRFIIRDVLFNLLWGTIIYREFPREFLFTSRTKRHFYDLHKKSTYGQKKAAAAWALILNIVEDKHV